MDATAVAPRMFEVLYVEDNEDDMILASELLDLEQFRLTWAADLAAARNWLSEKNFDMVLLDQVLPDGNGLSFLEEMGWSYPDLPVVLITGHRDEALAISAVKKGAANFVLKEEIRGDLRSTVEAVLRSGWEKLNEVETDRLTPWLEPYHPPAGAAGDRFLDRAKDFYERLLSNMNEGCLVVDKDGVVTLANEAVGQMSGCDVNHILGGNLGELFGEATAKKLYEIRAKIKQNRSPSSFAFEGWLLHGGPLLISGRSIHGDDGEYKSCILSLLELPARKGRRKF